MTHFETSCGECKQECPSMAWLCASDIQVLLGGRHSSSILDPQLVNQGKSCLGESSSIILYPRLSNQKGGSIIHELREHSLTLSSQI